MCGIVGYSGNQQAAPILMEGLRKLEYRGYDSAGVAVCDEGKIQVYKTRGRLNVLAELIHDGKDVRGCVGIGHTRWATHGEPSDLNSHPHVSTSGRFAVVHNGIIENYMKLKEKLIHRGYRFVSDTDTEIVANMVDYYYNGNMLQTMAKVLHRLEGSYALGVICQDAPDEIIAVRKDSPLVVGLSEEGNYIASDIPAILSHTRTMMQLQDDEIVVLRKNGVKVYNTDLEEIPKEPFTVTWDVSSAEKGGYEHFMFKEIMEQPAAVRNTVHPRIQNGTVAFEGLHFTQEELAHFQKIFIVACGSAYHVGVLGKYIIEATVRIPTEAVLASEFRYCNPLVDAHTLMIVISQSGETADTLAALREGKRLGARILSIVNVVGSSIANLSDDVIYTWAGPEIAVATTKAYSTQLSVIYMLALYFAGLRQTRTPQEIREHLAALEKLPDQIQEILEDYKYLQYLASLFYNNHSIFFIGRNLDYGVALEGSLKLKEISYIHSEAYAAGELKHGTISLIEEGTLVVALTTGDQLKDKMISNMKEVKARGATVLAIAKRGNTEIKEVADHVFYIPDGDAFIIPSLTVVPLQIFAYYVASLKGYDIDKPRNLAKSVTVE